MVPTAKDIIDKKKRHRPFGSKKGESSDRQACVLALYIAGEMGQKFGAKKVILFGSLARGDCGPIFDIDLAVQGMPASRFFRAVA